MKLDSTAVAFFYCKYQDEQKKTFRSIARAFLAQLLSQNEDLLPYLYDQCSVTGAVSLVSSEMCKELLEIALKTMPKTFIIIDGLDECDMVERKTILSFLTSVIEKSDTPAKLRGLFISQDENDIRKHLRLAAALRLTENHNKRDIESFATKWSLQIQNKFEISQPTQEYIASAVCEGSDGKLRPPNLTLCEVADLAKACSCTLGWFFQTCTIKHRWQTFTRNLSLGPSRKDLSKRECARARCEITVK